MELVFPRDGAGWEAVVFTHTKPLSIDYIN